MQELLQAWIHAVAEATSCEAAAFCATPNARARATWYARKAEERAAKLEAKLRRLGVDPYEKLRAGEIK